MSTVSADWLPALVGWKELGSSQRTTGLEKFTVCLGSSKQGVQLK